MDNIRLTMVRISHSYWIKTLAALAITVFIPFGLLIWFREHQNSGFAAIELVLYPIVFGGGIIIIILYLKKYFLKDSFLDFSKEKGTWHDDLIWGIVLSMMYFILFYVERLYLSDVLRSNPNQELFELMISMRQNPLLLILWFGPVLWIGIALYEELLRVFLLSSLWKFSNHVVWTFTVVVFASIIFGLVHWAQGPFHVVTISLNSIITGFFFYQKRRLMPLVYAHGIYDGLQVAVLLVTYPT